MGFACPVCEIPHQDATHLANHLAFTAMTHGDDHEAWLDEAVPGWADRGEADLAAEVSELAPDAEYEQVFEDTVGGRGGGGAHRHDHDRDRRTGQNGPPEGIDPASAAASGGGELDGAARAVLEEARGLTAEMLGEGADDTEPGARDSAGSDGVETEAGDGTEREESGTAADAGAEPEHTASEAEPEHAATGTGASDGDDRGESG
mgnify:FL=1|jgi:hypothetical protein